MAEIFNKYYLKEKWDKVKKPVAYILGVALVGTLGYLIGKGCEKSYLENKIRDALEGKEAAFMVADSVIKNARNFYDKYPGLFQGNTDTGNVEIDTMHFNPQHISGKNEIDEGKKGQGQGQGGEYRVSGKNKIDEGKKGQGQY